MEVKVIVESNSEWSGTDWSYTTLQDVVNQFPIDEEQAAKIIEGQTVEFEFCDVLYSVYLNK